MVISRFSRVADGSSHGSERITRDPEKPSLHNVCCEVAENQFIIP
jgi:hypothetical protein